MGRGDLMLGSQEIIAARVARVAFRRIDIDVVPTRTKLRHGVESDNGHPFVGRLEIVHGENIKTLDLRCCHGVPVVVFADTCAAGWPVVERVLGVPAKSVTLASVDAMVRVDEQGETTVWEP